LGVLEVAGFTRTMRQQFLLGPSHLSGARGMELVALRFRRDGHVVEHNPGAAQVVVRLSASSALDPARPDPRFDANHHVPPVTVFQGVVTLPRSPALAHRDAATWATPDAITIPFARPFRYSGGALCIEIEGAPVVGSESTWWSIDAEQAPGGTVTTIGSACGPVAQRVARVASADPRTLRPGSTARFLAFAEPNSLAMMCVAVEQIGPIDLGFLRAPGCALYVLPVASVAAVVRPTTPQRPGIGSVPLQLPGDVVLLGGSILTQWAHVDGMGTLTTTNALQCSLAAMPSDLDASTVVALANGSTSPQTGRTDVGTMPVVQIDYRTP